MDRALINRFDLNYLWKLLPLKNKYTDWLSQKVRPIVNNTRSTIALYIYTNYIKSEKYKLSAISIKHFIMFLKFIKFTRKLNYDIQKFENIDYRVIIFRVKDFSDEYDCIFKSTNNFYKTNQVKKFLQQLQRNIFVEIFNDSDSMQILTFQHQTIIEIDQLAGIYRVTVFKQPGFNYLLARVVLMDDLFHYQYPFRFPDLFEGNFTKYKRLVRIEFIKTFSSKDPHKIFNIRQFFNTYRVSNQKIKQVKQIFIYLIKIFQQYQLIEYEGLLITNGSTINIHNLTTSNISDGIILYENFNTHSFYFVIGDFTLGSKKYLEEQRTIRLGMVIFILKCNFIQLEQRDFLF